MLMLTERTGEEYEVAQSKLPLGIFGNSVYEILCDKQHHTIVYPRSVNDKAHFSLSRYLKYPLSQLDIGVAPDGTGTQVVGTRNGFVKQRFVDAFVACVKEVYSVPAENLVVWISGPIPIFLVSDPICMTIAPYFGGHLEPIGKYQSA